MLYEDTAANRQLFRATLKRHRGNVTHARRELGVSHKAFYRYIVRFRLWETIDQARGLDTSEVDYEAIYRSAVPQREEGLQHLRAAMERRRSME